MKPGLIRIAGLEDQSGDGFALEVEEDLSQWAAEGRGSEHMDSRQRCEVLRWLTNVTCPCRPGVGPCG